MLVGVVYALGTQSAGLLDKWRMSHNAEQYRSKAAAQTAAILWKMGTIKVGDTLSNFAFEDIDGELHLLNEILADKTLITYMKPDCDGCLVELERLCAAANSPEDYEQVLIISSANPLHLHKLREDYGLGCLMLYDEERFFGSALKIMSYPFNLVVNRDRVILEVYGSVLLPDDYESLFSIIGHHSERYLTSTGRSVFRRPEPVEGRRNPTLGRCGHLPSTLQVILSGTRYPTQRVGFLRIRSYRQPDASLWVGYKWLTSGAPTLASGVDSALGSPAPYVIPVQTGIQMSCDKALSLIHKFASLHRQLDPRFHEGDDAIGHERFNTRQMWTSAGHVTTVYPNRPATGADVAGE